MIRFKFYKNQSEAKEKGKGINPRRYFGTRRSA
jgi:hypothetical protein